MNGKTGTPGDVVWEKCVGTGSTSPLVVDSRLYTIGWEGNRDTVFCLDAAGGGKRVWGLNLYDTYTIGRRAKIGRSGQRDYGYTTAPLVRGDWLIVEVGAKEGTLTVLTVAFARPEDASFLEKRSPSGRYAAG